MIKSNLRETGFAEQGRYQKSSAITAIWVASALGMIVLVFVSMVLGDLWKMSESEFSVFLDETRFMFYQIFQGWTFEVYLVLWALIFLALFFVTRRELWEQKLSAPPKSAKRMAKYFLRSVLALLVIFTFFYHLAMLSEMPDAFNASGPDSASGGIFGFVAAALTFVGPMSIFVYLIIWEFMYLAVKLVATLFVCHDKKDSIKLKILKGTAMPVCSCGEALSLWHILVSYLIPFVFMYSVLLFLCSATDDFDMLVYNTITVVFMSLFLSYDLTLVIYSVYMKIRYKMDYISIDHHIYEVTLFKKSYVKLGN